MDMTIRKKLFLTAFILSLYGPTLLYPVVKNHINTASYENRRLADFPELSIGNLFQFPAQFEEYYNDHVPFKTQLVQLKTRFDQRFLKQHVFTNVTLGQDSWMFYTVAVDGEDSIADYQHTNLCTKEEMDSIGQSFRSLQDRLSERGIRLYIFIAPNKESIYGQYMPDSITVYGDESRTDLLIPYLQETYHLPIWDLKKTLAPYADRYQLYYKYDTHWNDIGGCLAALEIIRQTTGTEISPESLDFTVIGTTDGDLARFLSLPDLYCDDPIYRLATPLLPDVETELVDSNENASFQVYRSSSSNERTLLLIGDSFSSSPRGYLPPFYSCCIFTTFDNYTPQLLDQYHVDDLVYMTVERNQKLFTDMENFVNTGIYPVFGASAQN